MAIGYGCYYFRWPWPYVYLLEIMSLIRYAIFVFSHYFGVSYPSNQPAVCEHKIRYAMEVREGLPVLGFERFLERRGAAGKDSGDDDDHDHECAICMSSIELSHEVRELGNCCHAFHRGCLDSWLDEGQSTCPLCRSMLSSSEVGRFA